MKVTVVFATPLMTPKGPVHEQDVWEDVREHGFSEDSGVTVYALKSADGQTHTYNWAVIQRVDVDPYGSIARPTGALALP